MITALNYSHVAIREADLDLSATSGIKFWFLPEGTPDVNETCVVWLQAGAFGTALHSHPRKEAFFTVEYGELEICVEGRWVRLSAGQSITVAPGQSHTVRNPTETSCLYFYTVTNA
ncbi:cupin domain-containing protein [Larkinella soli]|uniref:cupin domain-containing protein n=1 Tax=Larkinella soli TaxID=1770527 RepID=UPI000FFCA62F|nr:cupin domain-containing protein [Larkinella soli]